MLKKTILYGLLSFASMSPLVVIADTTTNLAVKNNVADTVITTKIKALYALSPVAKTLHISVVTMNGDVALIGTVATDIEYEAAISLAQSVDGVTNVNADQLMITKSKAPMADTYLTAKAKGLLIKEKLFGTKSIEYWPVTIETKNSVAYLAGVVDTEEQRANIIKLIEGIHGVTSVKSLMTVK